MGETYVIPQTKEPTLFTMNLHLGEAIDVHDSEEKEPNLHLLAARDIMLEMFPGIHNSCSIQTDPYGNIGTEGGRFVVGATGPSALVNRQLAIEYPKHLKSGLYVTFQSENEVATSGNLFRVRDTPGFTDWVEYNPASYTDPEEALEFIKTFFGDIGGETHIYPGPQWQTIIDVHPLKRDGDIELPILRIELTREGYELRGVMHFVGDSSVDYSYYKRGVRFG